MWAATADSYCPSREGELAKQNMAKPHERWDGKLCKYAYNTCEDEEAAAFEQTAPPLSLLLQGTAQRNAVTKRMAARTDNKKL